MNQRALHVYAVTGNTTPRRLGKVFPTGWTLLSTDDGRTLIAASTQWPKGLRGTAVTSEGTIGLAEVVRRQVAA